MKKTINYAKCKSELMDSNQKTDNNKKLIKGNHHYLKEIQKFLSRDEFINLKH